MKTRRASTVVGRRLAEPEGGAARKKAAPQESLRGTAKILGDIVAPVVPEDCWDAVAGRPFPPVIAKSGLRRPVR